MSGDTGPSRPRIFISYRRDEMDFIAGWLYERLAKTFGRDQVFKDVDSIESGADFVDAITAAVSASEVLLALIGKQWLTFESESGGRRLEESDDLVRLEIETALAKRIRIIPVLVNGAHMPNEEELPKSIAMLARRQALELRSQGSELDIRRLIEIIEQRRPAKGQWQMGGWRVGRVMTLVAIALVIAVVFGIALIGIGPFTPAHPPAPGQRAMLANVTTIVAGWHHSLALLKDGTVMSWGHNEFGELGDGTTARRSTPAPVPGLTDVVSITAGDHTLALLKDGTVKAWGKNDKGQIGDGTTTNRLVPITVPGLTDVVSIVSGLQYNLALLKDGTVKAWGYNQWGQLGDGSTVNRSTPVTIPGLGHVIALAAALGYSLAVLDDGTVRAWGANDWGMLGDGTTVQHTTPTTVTGLSHVVRVAAWGWHSLALLGDGSIRSWGNNSFGQLGDGTTTDHHRPTAVPGLTDVIAIAAGQGHSLALLRDGTVRAWGDNAQGQLGDGTTTNRADPTTIPDLTGVVAIDAGGGSVVLGLNLALLEDGTVKAWGNNDDGQLGDGTSVNRTTPVTVIGHPT